MRKRLEDTREKKTGYRSPFHDPNIRSKARETLKEKTGYDNPWKDPSLKHSMQVKIAESLSKNETIRTSEQQKHIASVLNAKLNQNIDIYVVDMVLGYIVIEYDGGGHLYYKKSDKCNREEKRNQSIIEQGYKIIRYVTTYDVIFEDNELLSLFDFCYECLKNYDLVYIDVDSLCIHDSENIFAIFDENGIIQQDFIH
jgi:very-short-patch-repair endonuclease